MHPYEKLCNVSSPSGIVTLAVARPGVQTAIKKVYFTQWQENINTAFYTEALRVRCHYSTWMVLLMHGLAQDCRHYIEHLVDELLLPHIQQMAANGGGSHIAISDLVAFLSLFILPNLEELQINSRCLRFWPRYQDLHQFFPPQLWSPHHFARAFFSNLTSLNLEGNAISLAEANNFIFLPHLKQARLALVSHRAFELPFHMQGHRYPTSRRSQIEQLHCRSSAMVPADLKCFLAPFHSLRSFTLQHRLQQSDRAGAYVDHDKLHPTQLILAIISHKHIREQLQHLSLNIYQERLADLRAAISTHLIRSFEKFIALETLEVDFELFQDWWPKVRGELDVMSIRVNIAKDIYEFVESAVWNYMWEEGLYYLDW
jgi:hypothetical protein